MPQSAFDRIVTLINEASLAHLASVKVSNLLQVKELLIHRECSLLDNFFEEVVKFQHDPNTEVKKAVIGFIEDACRVDTGLLKRAVGSLFYLFSTAIQQDPPSVSLLRCLTAAMIPIYRIALSRAIKVGIIDSGVSMSGGCGIIANSTADIALETFRSVAGLKDEIVRLMLPSEVSGTSVFGQYHPSLFNDAIRIQSISLIECVIILHSRRLPNSEIPRENEGDLSLDQIPVLTNTQLQAILEASTAASSATLLPGVCLVRPHRLAEEAERLFIGLSSWPVRGKPSMSSGSVTCPVLESVMDSLVNIAKQRPQFMDRVVQAFETVHVTLPPHFSDNQVSSVRKKLKNGLLQLLRHPAAVSDFQGRITILLTDLGATHAEVLQALQSHTELSRARLYPDPSTFMPNRSHPDFVDHGDVDMRQQQQQQQPSIPPILQPQPSVSVAPSNLPAADDKLSLVTHVQTTFPSTDSTIASSGSIILTSSSKTQEELQIPASTVPIASSTTSTSCQQNHPITSSGFTLAEVSFNKRLRKKARISSSTTSSGAKHTSKVNSSDSKGQTFVIPEIDLITTQVVPKLTTANVADLVLLSMVTLPDQMPASFHSTYTPIAAAGTSAQIHHLARMLAVQLTVWAGEGGQYEVLDRINQLELLLIPVDDDNNVSNQMSRKRTLKSESRTSIERSGDIQKESGKSKKRRMLLKGDQISAENDPEAEDALIRANAARKMHSSQTMNISTLVGYNTQQVATNESIDLNIPPPGLTGLVPMFTPSTLTSVQNTMVMPPTVPNMMVPNFNPSQPPPPLLPMMMMMPTMVPTQSQTQTTLGVVAGTPSLSVPFNQFTNTSLPMSLNAVPQSDLIAPTPIRPFSLDAVTTFLSRDVQRQLARDAFMRILEGLGMSFIRRQSLTDGTVVPTPGTTDLLSGQYDVNRMKLLTRLTTRRFGGNEFYNILIDHAIQNLRYGFELLSKLLMQEYCRYRGFQLIGFGSFLETRRHQLSVIREQIRKRFESSTLENSVVNSVVDPKRNDITEDDNAHNSNAVHSEKLTNTENKEAANCTDTSSIDKIPNVNKNNSECLSKDPYAMSLAPPDDLGCLSFYDCLLIAILQKLSNPDLRQHYFSRFLIEAPLLTPGATNELKRYCSSPDQATYGFEILRTLIETRPVSQREDLLNMLLHFCSVDALEIRKAALTATRELASSDPRWQDHIEMFAVQMLKKLLQPRPSPDIFPFLNQSSIPSSWTDEACQACAHLFLGLMPQSPGLMHQLAEVYTQACPNIKRCLLRMVDLPYDVRFAISGFIRLHNLVSECPNGAETLITRMIHILTDWPSAANAAAATANSSSVNTSNISVPSYSTSTKAQITPLSPGNNTHQIGQLVIGPAVIIPPPSLVERVYRLYEERVHDVRCLIPVIVGLSKQQVINALPKLIQLNEKVVKEVLTRLLHAFCLFVRLYLGKSTKPYVNLQSILHACRVCFAERRLFTQERLSVAIGQLLEQPVLPTLFMRTVMQALALHPRLAGYVINVLVRLIRKQVWKSEKLWDGFIRCCAKTRPQSYQVLLQLPPDRLEAVFQWEPAMRGQVRRYVENFSSAQRIHISKAIVEVLEHVPTPPRLPTPEVHPNKTNSDLETQEQGKIILSTNNSPASSGPGTPTRDEIPHFDTPFMAAAMFAQQQQTSNMMTSSRESTVSTVIDNQFQIHSFTSHSIQPIGSFNSISSQSNLHSSLLQSSSSSVLPSLSEPSVQQKNVSSIPSIIETKPDIPDDSDMDPTMEDLFEADCQQQQSHTNSLDEYDVMNHSPPQITMDVSQQLSKHFKSKPSLLLQEMENDPLDFEENSDPITERNATYSSSPQTRQFGCTGKSDGGDDNNDITAPYDDNHMNKGYCYDDDGEPPILPASRIDSVTSLKRWHDTELGEVRPTSEDLNNKQFNILADEGNHETSKSFSVTTTSSSSRPKRPVNVNKLEADRKRLEEEAIKYRQLKAERKHQQQRKEQSSNDSTGIE
ncbi:LOW QUALITY PROTEIN: symplekin, putative [Schistosoma mansoni]|uniref:symplekin, putative n=1 Tax=Schistosoma mansoni TaxID=6183 RepID=UPI00022C819A|nr:LOW QUALITY PROTEIN: symplekin, putative [Schistosoma mansoni]|eukprot:XP_018645935.1 LOW QUALITY PROTEIN: symplekin, putative [Schistosoma mansoni]